MNVYETRIDHLIAFDANTFASANIDQARIRGIEGILSAQIKDWQFNTNLTLLDPENRSSGLNRGNILPRRAEQSFRLDADRQFGQYYKLGAMLLAEGERYDDLANTRKMDSYVKFDLRAEYILNKHWRLQGRIENLFNERYETAAFFNQPGRNFLPWFVINLNKELNMLTLSTRNQIAIGLLLVSLMILTRSHHFASIHNLADASWAIFSWLACICVQHGHCWVSLY